MFIGFDYGTANCSVAIMENGEPKSLFLEKKSPLLPSMLSAPTREVISEWLFKHQNIPFPEQAHQLALRRACSLNQQEDITVTA
ncbi:MAG: hypothetical protein XXXJIFNMEKO3_01767 [Candidatus Erwinia impunctatus]